MPLTGCCCRVEEKQGAAAETWDRPAGKTITMIYTTGLPSIMQHNLLHSRKAWPALLFLVQNKKIPQQGEPLPPLNGEKTTSRGWGGGLGYYTHRRIPPPSPLLG